MIDRADHHPTALAALLSAYAGSEILRHRLLWTLDARLARLVGTTKEPIIGQMQLAWWQEVLSDETGRQGRGDPLVDALRAAGENPPAGLTAWLDGWEAVIADVNLEAYAAGRGGGLFQSLTGEAEVPSWLLRAGEVWALWDFSGHVSRPDFAAQSVGLAKKKLLQEDRAWPSQWRPMQIAYDLARHDIIRGRTAPSRLTPRLYFRLLRAALASR